MAASRVTGVRGNGWQASVEYARGCHGTGFSLYTAGLGVDFSVSLFFTEQGQSGFNAATLRQKHAHQYTHLHINTHNYTVSCLSATFFAPCEEVRTAVTA